MITSFSSKIVTFKNINFTWHTEKDDEQYESSNQSVKRSELQTA
jgi:hypothetical protein